MKLPDTQPEAPGKILDHDAGIGESSEAMVDARARELAQIAGLDDKNAAKDFHRQAREELRGTADPDAPADDDGATAGLVAYDDVPGESGMSVGGTNAANSGDEQTIGEALYGEGVSEAAHDRMVESRGEEFREAGEEEI